MKILLSIILMISSVALQSASVFTVDGRKILLNNEPFTIKGICYNPVPIGETGIESPFGDYFTTLFLSRTAADTQNMQRMGANVVRVYGWAAGTNHTTYLDRSYNDGINPLYVFINRYIDPNTNWGNPGAVNAIKNEWLQIAEETKDHPAIIGYLLGNENNAQSGNGSNPLFWAAMEEIAAAVKAVAPDKLVSVPITDAINQVEAFDDTLTSIDFWSIQVYRSTTFGTFFQEYATASEKPVVLTEFGYDAYDNIAQSEYPDNAAFTADVVEGMIQEINANSDLCAGGCFFSYRDGWWKAAGSLSTHDNGGIIAIGMPDRFLNEEWWGIFAAENNGFLPDILKPRALYYRLISLWNPLPEFDATVIIEEPSLIVEYTMKADDRDFRYSIQTSTDLDEWISIADNDDSIGLVAKEDESLIITETAIDATIQVRVEDPEFLNRTSGTFLRARVGSRP
jgi:hypothetical protein